MISKPDSAAVSKVSVAMEHEISDTVIPSTMTFQKVDREEETLAVTPTAVQSFDDFLCSDGYSIRGAFSFWEESCNQMPLERLDYAFSEPSETLFHCDRFQWPHPDHISLMDIHDPPYSATAEPESNDSSLLDKQAPLHRRDSSPFVEWKPRNIDLLQPKKRQSLLKRCIRFLKDIDNHKIVRPSAQGHQIDSTGCSRLGSNYDKLAIHHVVAERKRREQMNEHFSALRALIPVSPKKGRVTVLQHAKEYLVQLKRRIEELERRNRELEELLGAEPAYRGRYSRSL